MENHAPILDYHRRSAHELLKRAEELKVAAARRPVREAVGTVVGRELFGMRKGNAQLASKLVVDLQDTSAGQALAAALNTLTSQVEYLLRDISVRNPSLSNRGNSTDLVRKLMRAKQGARIETRIRNVAHALDDICAMDLLYNRDIPAYLDEVAREKALRKRREREALMLTDSRPFGLVGISPVNDRAGIEAELKAHPEVVRTLLGSLDALTSDSKDGPRQACASARNALEQLVRDLTDEARVKEGLAKLVGEAHTKVIAKTYDALSAAVHGPAPTRKVAEFNVQVVLATCVMLVHAARRPA